KFARLRLAADHRASFAAQKSDSRGGLLERVGARHRRPHHFAAEAEQVEPLRAIAGDARRQNCALPQLGAERDARELIEDCRDAALVGGDTGTADVLPSQPEGCILVVRAWLDFRT